MLTKTTTNETPNRLAAPTSKKQKNRNKQKYTEQKTKNIKKTEKRKKTAHTQKNRKKQKNRKNRKKEKTDQGLKLCFMPWTLTDTPNNQEPAIVQPISKRPRSKNIWLDPGSLDETVNQN